MSIGPGIRLGPYEIIDSLGAGGMGEVWRARDTRLQRQVAIKVLPAELARNAQLHARFDREAKAISSLNHPNICTLHDVGHEGGRDYLVMELVEGESLAERLDRGALPLEEALRYGIQIASALDRAHRQGVIHRDLKPANVMVARSEAKLLDFGLAKMAAEGANGVEESLPTRHRSLTEEGTILGTVQYMAPEQLEGKEADSRTDIFAFGMLMFEMVTGRKAFEGKSRVSLMAAILEHQPPSISTIRPITPPALDRLVQICLRKNPDDRWQTAHDVELQLRWIEEGGSDAGLPAPVIARRKSRERISWVLAGLGLVATLVFGSLWLRERAEPARLFRTSIVPPAGMAYQVNRALSLSPDGSKLVFAVREGTVQSRLYVRDSDALEPRPLSGTEGGEHPFWSPDGRDVGFFAGDRLKRVAVAGGPPQTVCDAPAGRGGTWSPDDTIVFSSGSSGGRGVLSRVPARGGTPIAITRLESGTKDFSHRWPWFLPGGKHLLFLNQTGEGGRENDDSTIEVLTLKTGERKRLVNANSSVQYVPSGHLLFWRERSLIAQPFDARRREVRGDPVPIAENVGYSGLEKGAFSASNEGTLVYHTHEARKTQFVWFDRDGNRLTTVGEESEELRSPDLSWDDSSLVYELDGDVWVRDLERGTTMRLTFGDEWEGEPLWSPDGEWIVFSTIDSVYRKRSSGLGDAELISQDDEGRLSAYSWSADGRYLFGHVDTSNAQVDAARLDLTDGKVETMVSTPFLDVTPYPSPDGKWLAVSSSESGFMQLYVHRLESPGGRWQISTDAGVHPVWSRDGKTIFYFDPGGPRVMAVEVETGETFRAGKPVELLAHCGNPAQDRPFDVTSDGSRIICNSPTGERDASPTLTLVQNWQQGLRQ
jgi:eukaryotic-like serine/threonine-protein kinase